MCRIQYLYRVGRYSTTNCSVDHLTAIPFTDISVGLLSPEMRNGRRLFEWRALHGLVIKFNTTYLPELRYKYIII